MFKYFNDSFEMINTKYLLYFLSVGFLIFCESYLTISENSPTIYSPVCLITALPAIIFPFKFLSFLIVPTFYIIWSTPLIYGQKGISKKTKIISIIFIFLSILYLIGGLPYGLRYQGINYVASMYIFNAIFWFLLLGIFIRNKTNPSFFTNLAFHGLLFFWFSWCAFPWMGESI